MDTADATTLAAAARLLSATHRAFLEHVLAQPAGRARASYPVTAQSSPLHPYPQQAWPTFLAESRRRELAAAARGLFSLIKAIPRRRFDLDPNRLLAFYRPGPFAPPAKARLHVEALLARPASDAMVARPDFFLAADGFQMLECNVAGFIGGWETRVMAARSREERLIRDFATAAGVELRATDTLAVLLDHFVAKALPCARAGERLQVAFIAEIPPDALDYAQLMEGVLADDFARALARLAPDRVGQLRVCGAERLAARADAVTLDGDPVHGLWDMRNLGYYTDEIIARHRDGRVVLIDGPAGRILTDKRNLALLSEDADEGRLTGAEAALVRAHLPWTRLVTPSTVTAPDGAPVDLPEYVRAHREELVLKDAQGRGGSDVEVGRAVDLARWDAVLERALGRGDWIVQRHVEAVPLPYRVGEDGAAPHTVVWGAFVVGEEDGGVFLRMMPRSSGEVVNSARGATDGVVFVVDE